MLCIFRTYLSALVRRLGVVDVLYVSAIQVANSKNLHLFDRPLWRRGRSQAMIVLRERMNAASEIAATAQVRFVRRPDLHRQRRQRPLSGTKQTFDAICSMSTLHVVLLCGERL